MDQTRSIQRKLTTILSADAANYTGLMARDEEGTVQALRHARGVIDKAIAQRGGRIANTSGDGLIAEFPSVVEAVVAAIVIQRDLNAARGALPFRLGVHLGDVIVEGSDLLGDGVNLAARLQEMAPEGGILASRQVVDQVRNRLSAEFHALGPVNAKHMPNDIEIFAVIADGVRAQSTISTGPQSAPKTTGPIHAAREEKYLRMRTRTIWFGAALFGIDLLTGPGTFWSVWPISVLAILVWLHHRRVYGPGRQSKS